jgi:6-pyruvoyltetrahydropterin/6-carboxytetrahydropterin synthase
MREELEVTQEFMFAAAHRLPGYDGPCEDTHGHNYKLTVTVKGPVHDKSGMVIDFRTIENLVKDKIFPFVDHKMLNDFMENPTVECMIIWIWDKLKDELPGLYRLTLHEQPGSSVSYSGP